MDKPRPCGCKGCRTCLLCEETYNISPKNISLTKENSYIYCPYCNKTYPGWDFDDFKDWTEHPKHNTSPLEYPGIYIDLNFLSPEEENELIQGVDAMRWDLSQSGRRKQNFGPKCNFKKNKLKLGDFSGFPKFSKFVQDKFQTVPILKDYQTIEQCSLEYDPKRGASIDPHIDDCWIWGERIISVNLLADSVLTMTYNNKLDRYNLHLVQNYGAVLDENGKINQSGEPFKIEPPIKEYPIVRIPMPRRSLLVMYGAARYNWEHQVLREDITERRICLAYREFTPFYLPSGDKEDEGVEVIKKAQHFF